MRYGQFSTIMDKNGQKDIISVSVVSKESKPPSDFQNFVNNDSTISWLQSPDIGII